MVSFSEYNTYIGNTRAEDRQFAAPADQVGDQSFDLDEFERSRPGTLPSTSDPVAGVQALARKTEVLTAREVRAIRQLRQSKREAGTLRVQMKGKKYLYSVQRERARKTIVGLKAENRTLANKNLQFFRHSEECKKVLKKWKERESQLLGRVAERNREVESLKAQMESLRAAQLEAQRAHTEKVADLTQQISSLQVTQVNLENDISQLRATLSEMTTRNEEYQRQAEHVQEKEAQLASVRVTLQSQLQLLVTMSPPTESVV